MHKVISAAALALFTVVYPLTAHAADMVKKQSPFSVSETLDRLEKVLGDKGITIMARVDHGANAEKVNLHLRPTQVLIFGKPELGTRLMQEEQTIAIDLPMKVLAWEDASGQVWLGYVRPGVIAARHAVTRPEEIIGKMEGGLDKLTDAALKP